MAADNPFLDPNPPRVDNVQDDTFVIDSTLAVGRDASLTLGTDSLIVLDEALDKEEGSRGCCGMLTSGTANTRSIPFYNILWAELVDSSLSVHYASPTSKTSVRPVEITYSIDNQMVDRANKWIVKLLDRSYKESQQRKRIKLLVNPHSGKGGAEKYYTRDVEPLLRAARCTVDMVKTKYPGEAVEIVEGLDINEFDVVAPCSGDGLAYEVFNGLGKSPDARKALEKIAVAHIPCGSGNAMSHNLNGTGSTSLATLAVIKGIRMPLDLVSITQGETRTLSFLSQAVGVVAESDLATEHLRWMGAQRFTYGFLVRLAGRVCYPCDIAVKVVLDDKELIRQQYAKERSKHDPINERRGYKDLVEDDASASSGNDAGLPPLRYGTVNDKLPDGWELVPHDKLGNFYCGNMPFMSADANFFPVASPNDGCMDLLCINADISRLVSLQMMLALEDGKLFDMPGVWYRKVSGYRIIPKNQEDGYISIDGERVPFQPFQAEVHRGLGTVISKNGHTYETEGF